MQIKKILSLLTDTAVTPIEADIYEIDVELLNGRTVKLADFRNKALMIVNIASKCGFTQQLEELEELYQRYRAQGLTIIGVPSDDFFQEPYDNEQIQQRCLKHYGVNFPVLAKTHVRGAAKHPLYAFLVASTTNPRHFGRIKWNFTKFLIDAEGNVKNRFAPFTSPNARKVIKAIEALLK
jgi:glutathione peroxidase